MLNWFLDKILNFFRYFIKTRLGRLLVLGWEYSKKLYNIYKVPARKKLVKFLVGLVRFFLGTWYFTWTIIIFTILYYCEPFATWIFSSIVSELIEILRLLVVTIFKWHVPSFFEIFLPELILGLGIFILIVLFLIYYDNFKSSNEYTLVSFWKWWPYFTNTVIVALLIAWLGFYFYRACIEYRGFIFDFYSISLKICVSFLFIISAACLFVYYKNYNKTYVFELPLLFLFLLFFLFFLISSFDFLAVFFCTEGVTFCLSSVIVYSYSYEDSSYASLKYLILGSVAAGFFAFGSALLFSMTGTTNFYKVQKFVYFNLLKLLSVPKSNVFNLVSENSFDGFKISLLSFSVAILLIVFGLFFKLALAPMHQWSIDIYSVINWGLIALFSLVIKLSFFSVFMRVLFYAFNYCKQLWVPILAFSLIISLFIGSFGALNAFNFKDFIAYSSISQLGFFLIGYIACTLTGITSSNLFFFYYALSMILIFIVISFMSVFEQELSEEDVKNKEEAERRLRAIPFWKRDKHIYKTYTDVAPLLHLWGTAHIKMDLYSVDKAANSVYRLLVVGFNTLRKYSKKPLVAFIFSVAILNLAGLPPLPGFFAKIFILMSIAKEGYFIYVVVGLFFSLFSVFYYIKIFMLLWIDFLDNSKQPQNIGGLNKVHNFLSFIDYALISWVIREEKKLTLLTASIMILLTSSTFLVSILWNFVLFVTAKGLIYYL